MWVAEFNFQHFPRVHSARLEMRFRRWRVFFGKGYRDDCATCRIKVTECAKVWQSVAISIEHSRWKTSFKATSPPALRAPYPEPRTIRAKTPLRISSASNELDELSSSTPCRLELHKAEYIKTEAISGSVCRPWPWWPSNRTCSGLTNARWNHTGSRRARFPSNSHIQPLLPKVDQIWKHTIFLAHVSILSLN